MEFVDFVIQVSQREDEGYLVEVENSPVGESTPQPFEFPFSSIELENYVLSLQNALLRSGNHRRSVISDETTAVMEFGQILFNTLLTGDARNLYFESRNEASRQGVGLRIKLRIESPDLATLPWEFLYDDRADAFVSMSRNTPIVRYLSQPTLIRPLSIAPPLRILAMMASPSDQIALNTAVEKERLSKSLAELEQKGLVKLDWLDGETWRHLQTALYEDQYHVFHFVGHGYFDATKDEGMVVFSDEDGRGRLFSATDLARLLGDQITLRLCVLNSCEGAKTGVNDLFSSTAATLVKRGIPAVIAMQYAITDEAAVQMAESFYSAIAGGLPVDAALAEARKGINFALPGSLEWGTPVLFMRASDGRIFDIDAAAVPVPVPEAATAVEEVSAESPVDAAVADVPLIRAAAAEDNTPSFTLPEVTKSVRGRMGIGLALGAVLLVATVIGWILFGSSGGGGSGPSQTNQSNGITDTPTPMPSVTLTATQKPTMIPTPELKTPANKARFSIYEPVEFEWKKSELEDNQRYVFIIEDDGNSYCNDSVRCSDVLWMGKDADSHTLPKEEWYFLKKDGGKEDAVENSLRWLVVVSTTDDKHSDSKNQQPVSTVVASEKRSLTLHR